MMTVTIAVFIAFYAFFRVDRDELGRLKRLRINGSFPIDSASLRAVCNRCTDV